MIEYGGPGWETFWRDSTNGDDVFVNEKEGVVAIDLASLCGWHRKGLFCGRCFPRALAAVEAARRALDPEAPAHIRLIPDATEWPRMASLHNPITGKGTILRFVEAKRVSAAKTILSGQGIERSVGMVNAVRYVCEGFIANAAIVGKFGIAFRGSVPDDYRRRFQDVRITFLMDGEIILDKIPFADFAEKELPLVRSQKLACLFDALAVDEDGRASPKDWLSYFAPNNTIFDVKLEGVPGGGGLVEVESSWSLGVYTSRAVDTIGELTHE